MRVLVTNDDGIGRPGLLALVRELAADGHEVRVLAPDGERSGSSAGLGTVVHGARLARRSVALDAGPGVVAQVLDAPPATAVRTACLGSLGWRPDLVVSGVNPGLNTGRLVLHSGTVGAAMTAVVHDVIGLAVSTGDERPDGLASAAVLARWLVDLIPAAGLPPVALNLNVPPLPLHRLAGVVETSLSVTSVSDVTFEADDDAVRVVRLRHPPPFEPGTDAHALSAGCASLTVLAPGWGTAPHVTALAAALHRRWSEAA